jgi:hypothetical protein
MNIRDNIRSACIDMVIIGSGSPYYSLLCSIKCMNEEYYMLENRFHTVQDELRACGGYRSVTVYKSKLRRNTT